jgi:hypothetical protein
MIMKNQEKENTAKAARKELQNRIIIHLDKFMKPMNLKDSKKINRSVKDSAKSISKVIIKILKDQEVKERKNQWSHQILNPKA